MSSTKKQLIGGVFYNAIAKYSGILISLVVTGVLSRELIPEDFGTVMIATVIISFFSIFCDFGITPAIIQKSELTKSDYSNIFSFTLLIGFLFAAIFFFSASWIASFYESPILIVLCQVLSLNLLFTAANIVPNALVYKAKRFRFISIRTIVISVVSGAAAIIAAMNGAGIYSLLINPICSSLFIFIVNYNAYPQRVNFRFQTASIRKIVGYSIYQFLFDLINFFTRNLDKLIIGKYMNMNLLGYYEKSYRLMMLPLQNITQVISPVMHPVFAEFNGKAKDISENYLKVARLLALIGFPLSVALFFLSRELILLIFGDQWVASIAVFRILSLSVGVQVVLSTSGSIFQASNATKILFLSGLLSSILNVAGILIGIFVFESLEAIAWGILITFSINFIQCYLLMYKVVFRLPIAPFFKQLLSPFLLCVILVPLLYGADRLTLTLPLIVSLGIKGMLFGTIWLSYVQLTGEYNLKKLIKR